MNIFETDYPYEDFQRDFLKYFQQEKKQTPATLDDLEAFFEREYREFSCEIGWNRAQLFWLAASWIFGNIEEFDYGEHAVVGPKKALVSYDVLKAVHQWYSGFDAFGLCNRPKPKVSEIQEILEQF